MGKIAVCAKVEPETERLLKSIKEEYGIDVSTVVRLAIEWFAPVFYAKLKELELNLKLGLDMELEKWLREVVKKARGRAAEGLG